MLFPYMQVYVPKPAPDERLIPGDEIGCAAPVTVQKNQGWSPTSFQLGSGLYSAVAAASFVVSAPRFF
jgi:hypothetical protein